MVHDVDMDDSDDFNQRLYEMQQRQLIAARGKYPALLALVKEYFVALDAFVGMFHPSGNFSHWDILEHNKIMASMALREAVK